jgi:hypothetical protein
LPKGSFDGLSKKKKDLKKKLEDILPPKFKILDLVVEGKKVILDMKRLLKVADCEDKLQVMKAMNQASSRLFYFGRCRTGIKEQLAALEEDFELWFDKMKIEFEDETSEKAKERKARLENEDEYRKRKAEIRSLNFMRSQADLAYNTMDKFANMVQSMGAMIRKEQEKRKSDMGFKDDLEN